METLAEKFPDVFGYALSSGKKRKTPGEGFDGDATTIRSRAVLRGDERIQDWSFAWLRNGYDSRLLSA